LSFQFLNLVWIIFFCFYVGHLHRLVLDRTRLLYTALHMRVFFLQLFESRWRECGAVNLSSHQCLLFLFKLSLLYLIDLVSISLSLDLRCFILVNLGVMLVRHVDHDLLTFNHRRKFCIIFHKAPALDY